MAVVNQFGYTVRDADASAGFLRADRLSPARGNQFITGQRKVWILTVSVVVESAAYRYVVQPESRGRGRIGNDQKAQVDSIVAALRSEPRWRRVNCSNDRCAPPNQRLKLPARPPRGRIAIVRTYSSVERVSAGVVKPAA
jgi:hypothetical protein